VNAQPAALVLALADPKEVVTGGTLRTKAMLNALTELGYDVRLAAPGAEAAYGEKLRTTRLGRTKRLFLPMPTMAGARSASIDEAVREAGHVTLAVCQIFQQAGYLQRIDSAVRWLDFSDLYSEFGRREARHRSGLPRLTAQLQAKVVVRQERRYATRADIVTAAGYGDMKALRARGMEARWLPTPTFGTALPTRVSSPLVIGFFGNFDYWPNVEAYRLITESWLPTWRPEVDLVVAGHGSDKLRSVAGVRLLGTVTELTDFYNDVDLVLAPVERGGGMKVKISEALTFGRPVVATEAALDGFPPDIRKLCLVADRATPPSIAALRNYATAVLQPAAIEQLRWAAYLRIVDELIRTARRQSAGNTPPDSTA
jgi:hypothetical protein